MGRVKNLLTFSLYCCLLSYSPTLLAKDIPTPKNIPKDIPVRYLGIEQGLSNNAVISIYQDHNGFLWFGTYDGLNRYDGYGFKIFHNIIGHTTSLPTNNIYTIEKANNHNLSI